MKKEQSVEELLAQIEALKVAVKKANDMRVASESKLQKTIQTITDQNKTIKQYKTTVEQYQITVEQYQATVKQYQELIERLKENYDIERFLKYAPQTENLTKSQMADFRKDLEETKVDSSLPEDRDLCASPEEEEKKAKKKWGRQEGVKTCGRNMTFSKVLPKDTVELDIKEDIKDQSVLDNLEFIRKEYHSQVSYVPSFLRCRETVTYIYKNKLTGEIVYKTPQEHDIIQGGKLTNGFIASYVADKIIWGLPFYRQAKRINLMAGCEAVSAQLLTSTFLKIGVNLVPIGECLYNNVIHGKSLHADETRLLVIHDDAEGKRKLGYFWMLSNSGNHPVSYCKFFPSRKRECAKELLSECKAVALQTDAYGAYASVVQEMNNLYAKEIAQKEGQTEANKFLEDSTELLKKGILLVGCAAHARRRLFLAFTAIYKNSCKSPGGQTCATLLDYFSELYAIEETLRQNKNLTEEDFINQRKKKAVPVLCKIKSYAKERKPLHEAEPKLNEALTYLLNQIDVIANYLESPELTPDNNSQERLIKTAVVARKASMFASVEEGARTWALMHSILQTAVLNGLNPTTYLKLLLDRVAKATHENILAKDFDCESLMPWNFKPDEIEKIWN